MVIFTLYQMIELQISSTSAKEKIHLTLNIKFLLEETLWEKEKMLVTNIVREGKMPVTIIFSFYYNYSNLSKDKYYNIIIQVHLNSCMHIQQLTYTLHKKKC